MLLAELQIQSFLSAHPHNEGWSVYHFCEQKAEALFLMCLPDCVQDKCPEALKACSIVKEPMMGEIDRFALEISPLEALSEPYRHKAFKSSGWIGSAEIDWTGSPLHFRSIFIHECISYKPRVLIAAKSGAALDNFLGVLGSYGRSRERGKAREILVVNGQNISVSPVGWDDLVLPGGMADEIHCNVDAFFHSRHRYRELGLPYRRGFLFAGPPGCGKTFTVKALASTTEAKVITVLPQADLNDYTIGRAFDLGKKYAPAIIVFEELEKLVMGEYVSLANFLNLVDGLTVAEGMLLVATSNDPASLDPALLHRPSRFDRVWKFPLPGYEQRLSLLRKQGGKHFSEDALAEVARNAPGFSMAYVQEIVVNALLQSANNGGRPGDRGLFESLEALKQQRRAASKHDETVETRATVGFGPERKYET